MKNPQARLVENAWQKILVRLRNEWMLACLSCGRAILLTGQIIGKQMTCAGRNPSFSYPKILAVKKLNGAVVMDDRLTGRREQLRHGSQVDLGRVSVLVNSKTGT